MFSFLPLPVGADAPVRPLFRAPILFFLLQKEKNGFNLPRKERGPVPTVVLNLTQKISAIIRPLRQSLPSERSLRSAHRLSAEPRSKTNTCGPMSAREGQAASVTLLRREQMRSASAPTRCGGSLRERADRVVRPYRAFRTASGERFSVRRRRADEGVSGIRRVRSNEPPVTADEIVCGYQRIFCPNCAV